MAKRTFLFSILLMWAVCIGSIFGVRTYLHKKPKPSEYSLKSRAIFLGMNNEDRKRLMHLESGMLRLNDESIHLVGSGYESEEDRLLSEDALSSRKIDFHINDILLLERRMMFSEAYKTLNNAEKQCLNDGFATIIFRNSEYFFMFDSSKYHNYVSKYGTECKTCEELKKKDIGVIK